MLTITTVLRRIMSNMETEMDVKARANSTADFRANDYTKGYSYQAEYGDGKTVVHEVVFSGRPKSI